MHGLHGGLETGEVGGEAGRSCLFTTYLGYLEVLGLGVVVLYKVNAFDCGKRTFRHVHDPLPACRRSKC